MASDSLRDGQVEDDVRPVRHVSGEARGFKLYLPGPPEVWRRLSVVVPLSAVQRAVHRKGSLMHVPKLCALDPALRGCGGGGTGGRPSRAAAARRAYATMLADLAALRDVLLWGTEAFESNFAVELSGVMARRLAVAAKRLSGT